MARAGETFQSTQQTRSSPRVEGGAAGRRWGGGAEGILLGSNEKSRSLPLSLFLSNTWNSFGQLHRQQQHFLLATTVCVCVFDCVCAVRVGVAFVTSRMHSNSWKNISRFVPYRAAC